MPCTVPLARYLIVDICQIWRVYGRKTRETTPRRDHPRISRFYPRRPCQRRCHRHDGRRARGPAPMRPGRPQSGGSRPVHGHCPRTVAAICSRAHRKVANALVNGRSIVIEGGNIAYSPITTTTAAWPAKEVGTMRVATTYDNGNIFMHFGRSEQFKIYDIQDGKVLNEQVVGTGGTGTVHWQVCLPTVASTRSSAAASAAVPSTRSPKPASRSMRAPRQLRCLRRGPHCRHARADRRGHLRLPWHDHEHIHEHGRILRLPRAITRTRVTRAAAATNSRQTMPSRVCSHNI